MLQPTPLARLLSCAPLLALLATTTGCTRVVAPPPAPPATMPVLGEAPPEPEPESGTATVLISTDTPARVTRLVLATAMSMARYRSIRRTEVLCEGTPCAVTLPYGDHEIAFEGLEDHARSSRTTVHVSRSTTVVNHTLGRRTTSSAQVAGGLVAISGAVLLGIALVVVGVDRDESFSSTTAKLLAVGGLGGIAAGGVLAGASPSERQDGATTQWAPGTAGRTLGANAGFRF